MAIIKGTTGDDKYPGELEGTAGADQIFGYAGNDVLIGFNGNDTLEGGAGADQLYGSVGLDLASYKSSPEDVTVFLQDLYAAGGDATGDTLSDIEGVIGSAYGDLLYGAGESEILRGEGGNDNIGGFDGNDRIEGGSGNDYLGGGAGNDEIIGGEGNDTAAFSGSNFVIADLVSGTAGGSLTVGSDRLSGIENLEGTINNDRLAGDAKANRLTGDYGADELLGRGGADRFVYNFTDDSLPTGQDRILDFSRAQKDKIDLSGVDANEQANGDQAFKFVGQGPYRVELRSSRELGASNTETGLPTSDSSSSGFRLGGRPISGGATGATLLPFRHLQRLRALDHPHVVDRVLQRRERRAGGEHPARKHGLPVPSRPDIADFEEGRTLRRLGGRCGQAGLGRDRQGAEAGLFVDAGGDLGHAGGDLVQALQLHDRMPQARPFGSGRGSRKKESQGHRRIRRQPHCCGAA